MPSSFWDDFLEMSDTDKIVAIFYVILRKLAIYSIYKLLVIIHGSIFNYLFSIQTILYPLLSDNQTVQSIPSQ